MNSYNQFDVHILTDKLFGMPSAFFKYRKVYET